MAKSHKMSVILNELTLSNFKCFGKKQVIELKKITLLTGKNSSGKSSILHSVIGSIQSGQFPYKLAANGKYINMGDFQEMAYQRKAQEIMIGFKVTGGSFLEANKLINLEYETIWRKNRRNSLPEIKEIKFTSPSTKVKLVNKNGWFLDFEYDPATDPNFNPKEIPKLKEQILKAFTRDLKEGDKKAKEVMKRFKAYSESIDKKIKIENKKIKNLDNLGEEVAELNNINVNYTFDVLFNTVFEDLDENLNVISSFRHHPGRTYLEQSRRDSKVDKNGDGYLDQIINWEKSDKEKFNQFLNIIRELELIHSIKANRIGGGRFEVLVTTKEGGIKTSLFDVGFGVSQFLPVIVADLQLSDNSTLLIAEPEIHLHPTVQARFGDYLVKQANAKNKHYIVETHSEYLLNRIRLSIVKEELKEEDLAVYYLENNGKDSIIHKLRFNKQGGIENAPAGFFNTYMMDLKEIAFNVPL